jgi:hypothetical protein
MLVRSWWIAVVLTLSGGCATPIRPAAMEHPIARAASALSLPFMTVDVDAGVIDLECRISPYADWLELIATSPQGKEHESLVTVAARPTHIHFALLALGLEPGRPLHRKQADGKWVTHPPAGPAVELFFVLTDSLGEWIIPANQWVVHRDSGESLKENRWLFTGSRIIDHEDQPFTSPTAAERSSPW